MPSACRTTTIGDTSRAPHLPFLPYITCRVAQQTSLLSQQLCLLTALLDAYGISAFYVTAFFFLPTTCWDTAPFPTSRQLLAGLVATCNSSLLLLPALYTITRRTYLLLACMLRIGTPQRFDCVL